MRMQFKRLSLAQQHNAQEQVILGYIRKGYLKDEEQQLLHMFFSPWRVPRRMTRGEVRMAVTLRKDFPFFVDSAKFKRDKCGSVMTRSGFLKLVNDVLRAMD